MNRSDLRGFDYPLAPAHQRAGHRVEAATGLLGQRQRELAQAGEHAQALRDEVRNVALRCAPAQRAVIDPQRALAASLRLQQLHAALAQARQEVQARERRLDEARIQLERARVEQEAFETHRMNALEEHTLEQGRKQQASDDQEWLSRRHVLQAEANRRAHGGAAT